MLKPFVAASCLCAAGIAQADPARLSGQEIRDLVAGATIEIDTPLGTKLPIRFARDGRLSGQARDLASYLGAPTDTGNWWVTSDQLCSKWKRWLESQPQCLRLSRHGRTLYWQAQDGNSGTATITVPAPVQIAAAPSPAQAEIAKPKPAPAAPLRPPAPVEAHRPAEPAPVPRQPSEPQAKPAVAESSWASASAAQASDTRAGSMPRAEPKPALPEPKRAAQPAFVVINVAHNDVLNVRSGPSAESALVGELRPGSRGITITGACLLRWCPVEHKKARGWVNTTYLAREDVSGGASLARSHPFASRDPPDAPRTCLTPAARALLERIEQKFGPVEVVSTCRPGAMIAGTAYPSRHASGNAVDFKAGSRKDEIVDWLIANHQSGGTMTYSGMDHIHVDIGRHFVSIAGGPHWAPWRSN